MNFPAPKTIGRDLVLKTKHIFPNGQVEAGTGEPGYRWVPAYSEATPDGYTNAVPLSEHRAMARRDGVKIVLHATEKDARASINK